MAILMQTVFSPRQGFDLVNDTINTFIANTALSYGKIVTAANTTGVLSLANDYGYFLMEEVTSDGPSLLELDLGDYQYERKAGSNTAVTVLIPKKGAIVRTKWVSKPESARDIAVGEKLNISNGIYITTASNDGTKGLIKNVYTDSLNNVLYDVEIL